MNCPACGKKLDIFDRPFVNECERFVCYSCKYIVDITDYHGDDLITDEDDEENSKIGC
jgi:hypothetical protein